MSADQQGADPKLCWNCGELGSLRVGSQMHCPKCDVMWMLCSSSLIISRDGLKWDGMPVEFVDFTKPDALSCPA